MSTLPRWLLRPLWSLHRAGYAITGGRLGLRAATADDMGVLRLRTIGRKSGQQRSTMLSYLPVAAGYAVVASNGGASNAPAWWLNLQARPETTIDLPAGPVAVRARASDDVEREELWPRFVDAYSSYERYAETVERAIPIVILEPIDEGADA
jgi:deazaflavin-dependent oxidoreductase (nitroreductase family)